MRYALTNGYDEDFASLCGLLEVSLSALAGQVIDRSQYHRFNQTESVTVVVIAYDGESPVGCAGLRPYEGSTAEVKRVFVREEYRGQGISKVLMEWLEREARRLGFDKLVLETGAPLVASIALYKTMGYQKIDNYGPYISMKDSICLGKALKCE